MQSHVRRVFGREHLSFLVWVPFWVSIFHMRDTLERLHMKDFTWETSHGRLHERLLERLHMKDTHERLHMGDFTWETTISERPSLSLTQAHSHTHNYKCVIDVCIIWKARDSGGGRHVLHLVYVCNCMWTHSKDMFYIEFVWWTHSMRELLYTEYKLTRCSPCTTLSLNVIV